MGVGDGLKEFSFVFCDLCCFTDKASYFSGEYVGMER